MIFYLLLLLWAARSNLLNSSGKRVKRNLKQYSGIVNIVANIGNNGFKLSLAGRFVETAQGPSWVTETDSYS